MLSRGAQRASDDGRLVVHAVEAFPPTVLMTVQVFFRGRDLFSFDYKPSANNSTVFLAADVVHAAEAFELAI